MKCKATTKSGKPCRLDAMKGSEYCHVHAKKFEQKKAAAPKAKAELKTEKVEAKKTVSPSYVKSTHTGHAPSWEKEEFSMDDKKNIGFVPGLALLLAVLALVLISINAVKPTPSVETLEKSMDKKIEGVNNSILAQVKSGDLVSGQVINKLFERDLVNLEVSLERFSAFTKPEMATDLDALKAAIMQVKAKLNPKPAE